VSFADAISEKLQVSGILVASDLIPDSDSFGSDVVSLANWLSGLEDDTREAIDQLTADNPVKKDFADPEVAIVSSLGPILSAFDATNASFSISATLDVLISAQTQAQD
jgi:hypothetical protein